jgi:DNA-binding HxlR family transcriptional regulator
VRPGHPPAVEYRLTPKGRALADVVQALECWATTWAR